MRRRGQNRHIPAHVMRRRARHWLKRQHWDPFERHVLHLIATHADTIHDIHRRIVAAPSQIHASRDETRRRVDDALDRFLLSLTPAHVALAESPVGIFQAASAAVMLHGLVEKGLHILNELRSEISGDYALHRETSEGLAAIGLEKDDWTRHVSSRTANLVWEIPPEVVTRMDSCAREDSPVREEARARSRDLAISRGLHNVRRTLHAVEVALLGANWDPMVAERLRMASHRVRTDEKRGRVIVDATIELRGFTQWEIAIPVRDNGLLEAGASLSINGIESESITLLGRRADRDARGLQEDDPALVAVPLISALRWRESPTDIEITPNERLHLNQQVELPQGVVVEASSMGATWITIPQQLPETIIDGMAGQPITRLIEHRWLDPRMIVSSGYTGSQHSRFLVHMPAARLRPVDAADGDPLEEWNGIQRCRRQAWHRAERRAIWNEVMPDDRGAPPQGCIARSPWTPPRTRYPARRQSHRAHVLLDVVRVVLMIAVLAIALGIALAA